MASRPAAPTSLNLDIQADPNAIALSEWVSSQNKDILLPRPQCAVPGLVLVAEWGWAESSDTLLNHYEQLCIATSSASNDTLFCKPAHASHFTIALLSSFKRINDAPRSNLTLEEDKEYLEAWIDALTQIFTSSSSDHPEINMFEIEAYKIEISPGAAIILFKDETESMIKLRSMVEYIRDNDTKLNELDEKYHGKIKSNIFIPNIIHSSYARFTKSLPTPPPTPVLNDMSVKEQDFSFNKFKDEFETNIAKSFQPFKVKIKKIVLADETSPYMHQEQNEKTTLFSFDLK